VRREHVLPTPDDTRALGAALAAVVRAGDLVVLVGPLGAGKTALTQGLGAALGVREPVTSPTFVISRVHRGGGCRWCTSTPTASAGSPTSTTSTSTRPPRSR
jgi:tRNA threonylcarbamoyladenosine biosynthesis protein TsaE